MHPPRSSLGPALFLAVATLAATALAAAAPRAPWLAAVGPLLFALALVGVDRFDRRRRSGRGSMPSASALFLAAAFLAACAIVGAGDLGLLAGMIPILAGGVAVPVMLGERGSTCSRA